MRRALVDEKRLEEREDEDICRLLRLSYTTVVSIYVGL